MEIKVITYEESRLEFFRKELKAATRKMERIRRTLNRNESPMSEKSLMLDDAGAEVSYYRDVVKMLEDNVKNNHKKATTVANSDTPTETDFKYFTAEQVRKMSRSEVLANYSDIMKSMKMW